MNPEYLVDLIVLLFAAVVAVPIARVIGLGTVPGFLIAGIIVGPSLLGLIDNADDIAHLAELGVVLLLFVIGIELKPSRLWLMRRLVFGLGTSQVVLTGALISAAAHYVFKVEARAAIIIGPALALSSTAFVIQLLTEQKKLTTGYGRASVSVLLFQDLAVVPLLALVSLLTVPDMTITTDVWLALLEAIVILALIIFTGRFLLRPILHRIASYGSSEVFTATAVLIVLGTAVLTAKIGLSMAMGAFLAGLLIADSEYRHQVIAELQPFRGLLLGLFFMSMGMSLDLFQFFSDPLTFLGLVALLMLAKFAVLWPLARLFDNRSQVASAIALMLAQSGEFALVLFSVASDAGVLSENQFQQLLVIVVLSMLATPPLAALARRLAGQPGGLDESVTGKEPAPVGPRVVVIGFGRVGRRVGKILEMRKLPYVAVDFSAPTVRRERLEGLPVFFGDARQTNVLHSLGLDEASLVAVTIDDFEVAEQIVSLVHRLHPQIKILARARDLAHSRSLEALGARFSVSETLEASLALAQAALATLSTDTVENDLAIQQFRQSYYSGDNTKSAATGDGQDEGRQE